MIHRFKEHEIINHKPKGRQMERILGIIAALATVAVVAGIAFWQGIVNLVGKLKDKLRR